MFCRRWFLAAILAASLHVWQPALGQQNSVPDTSAQTPTKAPTTEPAEIPLPRSETQVVPRTAPDRTLTNFVSCPLAELRRAVRQLAHLKPAEDQSQLPPLLSKIGGKTVEVARKTPNLISHEYVVFERGDVETRRNYSFLVLQHSLDSTSLVFDEYRVDLKSGEKMETDFRETAPANSLSRPSSSGSSTPIGSTPQPKVPAVSQGFISQWLFFYPMNQPESNFRYLGEQDINGHHTLVVAFAQKPGSVRLPATFTSAGKTFPLFMQGVVWVDSSDYRIVRLRTDLLSAPREVALRRLTADIQFQEIRLADLPSPLWVPREVVIMAKIGGVSLRESHTYSGYHIFRTHSKVMPQ